MKSHYSALVTVKRDREALNFIYSHLKSNTSTTILGMCGTGKDLIYTTFLEELDHQRLSHIPKPIHVTSSAELEEYVKELTDEPQTLAVINISSSEDCSDAIDKISKITKKNDNMYILFARPSNTKLTADAFILLPYSQEESYSIIESLEIRYSYRLSHDDRQTIYELSGGNMGLIRALFFLKRNNPNQKLSIEFSISDRDVHEYLSEIQKDIEVIGDKKVLEQFGFGTPKKPLTPLLSGALKTDLAIAFTKPEKVIFELLKTREMVTKKEIAQALWEHNFKKHYSDWALDQLIQNLDDKLTAHKSLQSIQKIKGVGYRLVTQS